jgi:hypothetical protein
MRSLAVAAAVAVLLGPAAGRAEKRLFIIANNPDGYGVDRCLANGAGCGKPVATAYCQSHAFARASSFRKVNRDEITGAIPTNAEGDCTARTCVDFVAIECSR